MAGWRNRLRLKSESPSRGRLGEGLGTTRVRLKAEAETRPGWHDRVKTALPAILRFGSLSQGSVRARANKYRLIWDEPIQGHAACKMASTVAVLRRWRSLRRSAGTC